MKALRHLVIVVIACALGFGAVGAARANPELLVDMETAQVLYAYDAGLPWHPASLTKLMTAYVTFEAIADGRVNLDTVVTVTQQAINQAPAKSGLPLHDTLSLKNALYIMLVKSANDMAVAIAQAVDGSEAAFAAEMNATAVRMGLTGTHYDNVNGLPDDGQITTARDLAVLAINIRRTFPQYNAIFDTRAVEINHRKLKSENDLLIKFAGTNGMKTGFVCGSGLNILATAKRNGRYLMAIILGGASARERNEMAAQLLLRGFAGEYGAGRTSVVQLVNRKVPPVDMTAEICGRKAKAYRARRRKAFPMGLKGRPSYLTDKIPPVIYNATDLGVPHPIDEGPQAQMIAPMPMPPLARG